MKKKNLIKGSAAGLLTLLLTAAMGCFASFAYDTKTNLYRFERNI